MKQKTYKKFGPYGYVKLAANPTGTRYPLLAPQPMVSDSWQRDNQQRWAVAVPDFDNPIKVDGKLYVPHTPVNMVISTEEAVVFFDPYMNDILVWDGDWADPDEAPKDDLS